MDEFQLHPTSRALFIFFLHYRDPYSFFLRVVSQASKPDGTLAQFQFELPRQKCRII